jgi:hypothetical protein
MAVITAKQEAHRRGWRKVSLDTYHFRNGAWRVHVYKNPLTITGSDAWVTVSPTGQVIEFDVNGE